ncbi:MAG: hypothetical protein KJN81_04150 [Acidimicrobiia bacterium]|nr:hypothetical protein [Acidimicrobiia bacterium]NNL27603.1 hypothetical protein [Acidimicrobiia bacterium]
MKPWFGSMMLLLVSSLIGCSGDATGPEETVTSIVAAGRELLEPEVVISEVFFGQDGYVAVTNHGEGDAVLDRWEVCQSASCFSIPNMTLDSGDTVVFAADESGGIEDNIVDMRLGAGDLVAAAGEIALYSGTDPKQLVSYVMWGRDDQPRSAAAVEAGLWSGGPVATVDQTDGIVKSTAVPLSADDWTPT